MSIQFLNQTKMTTNKYIKRLIRNDFDKCDDDMVWNNKAITIIAHATVLGYDELAEEMYNDLGIQSELLEFRIEALTNIHNND